MLEYFFHDEKRGWGINNNAYKQDLRLRRSLDKTLKQIKLYPNHLRWLYDELELKRKKYDEEGLLTILIAYRNIFNENKYFSLAFVTLVLSNFVVIKKRLAPFVSPSELDDLYNK